MNIFLLFVFIDLLTLGKEVVDPPKPLGITCKDVNLPATALFEHRHPARYSEGVLPIIYH
jgi:hypothetical protein